MYRLFFDIIKNNGLKDRVLRYNGKVFWLEKDFVMLLAKILKDSTKDIEFNKTAVDSRKVEKGDLFAVFTGSTELNRQYAEDAVRRGAAVILTDDEKLFLSAPVVCCKDAPLVLGEINKALFQPLPAVFAAVTGTNGKTSTVSFLRQIWDFAGFEAASLGTLGMRTKNKTEYTGWTTADNVTMFEKLCCAAREGVKYVAIEASSHGLALHRLAGLKFKTVGFTNLTQDHLDFHKTMENYFLAKMKLFEDYAEDGATAVINADIPEFARISELCAARGLKVYAYGKQGNELRLVKQDLHQTGQSMDLEIFGRRYNIPLQITGSFQAWNALCALGMALASGVDEETAVKALSVLKNPEGRMELVGTTSKGACVYVDFAHTPDGIKNALESLRHHAEGKLWIVFGCGGNRDTTKRPKMGALAGQLADEIIVTDDNPRFEDPAEIRKQIMAAVPKAHEIGCRTAAIKYAIEQAEKGDIILLAGKGHEEGQIVQGKILPFNDKQEALKNMKKA